MKKKNKKIITIIIVSLLLITGVTCGVLYSKGWLHKIFKASDKAYEILETKHNYIIETLEDGSICFEPDKPESGFVFYPGGMVDYISYSPLMDKLASNNILCVLLKPKTNVPMFDVKEAEGITNNYPNVSEWYIGGHSLGAYLASEFVFDNINDFNGIVLLGGYSAKDLSNSNLKALCVYGSLDGVMDRQTYKENIKFLPSNFEEVIIDGGCHSYFGDYGIEGEDVIPTISQEKQIEITSEKIIEFINNNN